jgi:hypothetical protein
MPILEVGEDGVLHVPGELLAGAPLRPAGAVRPFWRQATPAERAEAFGQWASTSQPDAPDLPDECLRREGLYD